MKKAENSLEINLLGKAEQQLRLSYLKTTMQADGIEQALIRDNANLYYLSGRVFRGYIFYDAITDRVLYLVRRPSTLTCEDKSLLHFIKRPNDIAEILHKEGIEISHKLGLELDTLPYNECRRMSELLTGKDEPMNLSVALRVARSVKTPREQELLRMSGAKQTLVYERIPHLYQEGMTDIELQVEIERSSRLEGCLGQFRISGGEMELFMGNILTGDNADTPSPYDFAMGGEGLDPSLPVGANGTVIEPGKPVMVDINGNYTGYMTDMTRCFFLDSLNDELRAANELSVNICRTLASMMRPGAFAAELYNKAVEMVEQAGMTRYFMGHRYHAGFVGHGVGIEINELPVISPRSRDILVEGNVIALEPKFVIPPYGAIGIENTYIVGPEGGIAITTARTEPIPLT